MSEVDKSPEVDWLFLITLHDLFETNDVPMEDRDYDEELVNVAVALLRNGYTLSVDMTAQLLEEGIDVDTLIEMYSN